MRFVSKTAEDKIRGLQKLIWGFITSVPTHQENTVKRQTFEDSHLICLRPLKPLCKLPLNLKNECLHRMGTGILSPMTERWSYWLWRKNLTDYWASFQVKQRRFGSVALKDHTVYVWLLTSSRDRPYLLQMMLLKFGHVFTLLDLRLHFKPQSLPFVLKQGKETV